MNQIDRLLTIMQKRLRPGKRLPWDKEQTFATIAPYTRRNLRGAGRHRP